MAEQSRRLDIPLWVALAGMVVALILAIVIMANVLRPLVNLIFPTTPEPPLPDNITLLETNENPRTSTGEWLYATEMDGCDLMNFYLKEGGTCNLSPFTCLGERDANGRFPRDKGESIGVCRGESKDIMNSYSWEVLIGSGYADHYTKFRVYLYQER